MIRVDAELEQIFPVLDRLLIQPLDEEEKLESGLVLPPTVREGEKLMIGFVVRVGPGYPVPIPVSSLAGLEERNPLRSAFFPLQAKEKDLAIFDQKQGVEIYIRDKRYFIVPQSAVYLLIRNEKGTSSPLSSA